MPRESSANRRRERTEVIRQADRTNLDSFQVMSDIAEQHFGLTFIATGEQTAGRYFQCTSCIPAGDSGPPLHSHANESEGFYVLSGSLTLTVSGCQHYLQAGDYLNVMPDEPHTWINSSDEVTKLLITFSPSGIENMFRELDKPDADLIAVGKRYGMTIIS